MTKGTPFRNFFAKVPFIGTILETIDSFPQKSPRGKWNFYRDVGSFVLQLTGANILDPDFEVTLHSSLCGLIGLDYIILIIYTIYYYSDNLLVALRPIATTGGIFPVIKKKLFEN